MRKIQCVADASLRRLVWRSRRGMLELDLALEPLRKRLPELDSAELAAAKSLLASEDPYLWSILVTGNGCPLPEHCRLLAKLGIACVPAQLAS